MSKVDQLGYVGTGARDLDAWRSFAGEVLGHEVTSDSGEDLLYLRMDDHHHRLAIHRSDVEDVAYVGWEVRDALQLAAVAAEIERHGVAVKPGTPEEAEVRRVVDLVSFECPFTGVRMEIAYGPEARFVPRFLPSRPISGFKTGALGLGHLVLYTPDVIKTEAFYRDALGFAVSDRAIVPGLGTFATFMHCNPRHHSLAFIQIPAPRKLQHIMFETLDIDDVGTTYDLCLEREITTTSLGRHLNDRMFSFYFRGPSGWHFEFGWGAREVDPATWSMQHYNAGRGPGEWGHAGLMAMV